MSQPIKSKTTAVCPKCGSSNVECSHEYDTDGAAMEGVDWKHECKDCGHKETSFEHHCYGQSNEYTCGIGGCSNKFQT